MKFTCQQTQLTQTLTLVSRAVSSRPTHPILGHILLEADAIHGTLKASGFDLSLSLETTTACTIERGGAITLPAKLFTDIVAKLPNGDVTVEVDEEGHAAIACESGKFNIRGLMASEYPQLPIINGEALTIPAESLSTGLKGVVFSASHDETKQILTGVHITAKDDALEFAATDGHRLSVVKAEAPTPTPFEVTLPSRALRELDRLLTPDATVEFIGDDSQASFRIGEHRLTCRKLEGAYPAYRQLIPKDFSRTFTVDRRALIAALERVNVLSDQKNRLVKFDLAPDKKQIQISVEAADLGLAQQVLPADITGVALTLAFNIGYLLEGLKNISCDQIKLELNGEINPAIAHPIYTLDHTYLVMPVTIR